MIDIKNGQLIAQRDNHKYSGELKGIETKLSPGINAGAPQDIYQTDNMAHHYYQIRWEFTRFTPYRHL